MSTLNTTGTSPVDFEQVQSDEKFQKLRSTHRSFVFPMAIFFLVWYLAYVLMAAYFPQVMAISVLGNINLGLVLGLAQFLTTFLITGFYVAFANRRIDPLATELRAELEAAGAGLPGAPAPAPSTSEAPQKGTL